MKDKVATRVHLSVYNSGHTVIRRSVSELSRSGILEAAVATLSGISQWKLVNL